MKRALYIVLIIFIFAWAIYVYIYYPQQSMPIGEKVVVHTISPEKYHDDCLHPCVRYDALSGSYFMAQSPYYAWDNKVENPIFYSSDSYMQWTDGHLIAETPETGYNSDPNICLSSDGSIYFIWRECYTPLCDSLKAHEVTVGGKIVNNFLSKKEVYCINHLPNGDIEQAPVMIEHGGERYIYAAWYQYEPIRKNKGIAIWKEDVASANRGGGQTCKCQFVDSIAFESCITADRVLNIPLFGHIFYIPKPLYHDLWHFDLFEYANKLYMVSVAEKGDNIMLSVSEDWRHFKTFHKPLVNNHYTENFCGYRQYYYKPTAFVKDDTLHVFYTANAKEDPKRNQLYHTSLPAKKILK